MGVRGVGLGFVNSVGTGGVWDMCLCCIGMGGWPGPGWCYVFGAPSVQSCCTLSI